MTFSNMFCDVDGRSAACGISSSNNNEGKVHIFLTFIILYLSTLYEGQNLNPKQK